MKREIEKLCQEMNQLRISISALCTAIGENSTRIELLCSEHHGLKKILDEQLHVQQRIFETKGDKTVIPQQDFYPKMLNGLEEIKVLLNK